MEQYKLTYPTIDDYIAQFPGEVQDRLNTLRAVIHEEAPLAQEKISYGMPTFAQFGNVCHFAAFTHHIGFFPGANGVAQFLPELKDYNTSKGTIQFPFSEPLPLDLVRRIVRFRVEENIAWEAEKKGKKKVKKI